MLIDVFDVSTLPIGVKDKIFQSFSALPKDVVDEIKSHEVNYNKDIMRAIEKIL